MVEILNTHLTSGCLDDGTLALALRVQVDIGALLLVALRIDVQNLVVVVMFLI